MLIQAGIPISDKRTSAWLKLKKDYVVGLGDSLDLVPIGAWHGNGRKAQWWSPILLAVSCGGGGVTIYDVAVGQREHIQARFCRFSIDRILEPRIEEEECSDFWIAVVVRWRW